MKPVEECINELAAAIEERAKIYNGDGSTNFAFAYGFLSSDIANLFRCLELDAVQLRTLEMHVQTVQEYVETCKKSA